ncbi:hypothetical protein [Rhizobium multihospitium]|nr:hypothetical protein [Rhizobium multihospitium]
MSEHQIDTENGMAGGTVCMAIDVAWRNPCRRDSSAGRSAQSTSEQS